MEQVLLGHQSVAQGGVIVTPGPAGDLELAGFAALIAGAQEDAASLRRYLATQLPRHLVPGSCRSVARAAGHGQRQGRPSGTGIAAGRRSSGQPKRGRLPASERTAEEAELAALFAEVLGNDLVGVHDSFFDVGGHSLSAVRLVGKIGERFGIELELDELYETPTIAALARLLAARDDGGPHPASRVPGSRAPVPRPNGSGPGRPRMWSGWPDQAPARSSACMGSTAGSAGACELSGSSLRRNRPVDLFVTNVGCHVPAPQALTSWPTLNAAPGDGSGLSKINLS